MRTPAFTATAVLTLGVGLGAATATHALVASVVLDPLGYPDAERLVVLRSEVPGAGTDAEWQGSFAQYDQFRSKARTLAGIGLYATVGVNVDTPSGASRPLVALVSASTNAGLASWLATGRAVRITPMDALRTE